MFVDKKLNSLNATETFFACSIDPQGWCSQDFLLLLNKIVALQVM